MTPNSKPKCPDCKTEEMEEVDSTYTDPKGNGIGYDIPVYRCPKCGAEYQEDEV